MKLATRPVYIKALNYVGLLQLGAHVYIHGEAADQESMSGIIGAVTPVYMYIFQHTSDGSKDWKYMQHNQVEIDEQVTEQFFYSWAVTKNVATSLISFIDTTPITNENLIIGDRNIPFIKQFHEQQDEIFNHHLNIHEENLQSHRYEPPTTSYAMIDGYKDNYEYIKKSYVPLRINIPPKSPKLAMKVLKSKYKLRFEEDDIRW